MLESLTFLHAADLHLGAPFRGLRNASSAWADRLERAIPEAYDRLVYEAIDRKVDFVVIAGDIFDTSRPSYADYTHFFEGLRELQKASIPVFMVTGNHDPYTTWRHDFYALPDNAVMLSAEHPDFRLVERDGEPLCVIGGRGYYNQAWPQDEDISAGLTRDEAVKALGARAAFAPFGVGLIHTGLDLDPNKAPVPREKLLRAGFDYWALGHVHSKFVYPKDNPKLVFSGCIQGRDIKETGERGVYVVTLTQDKPNVIEFIPTASVSWQLLSVDVGDCQTLATVKDKIMREQFKANALSRCEEMCSRITLTGATSLHETLSRAGVIDDMRAQVNDSYPLFYCDSLIDKTTAPRNRDALLREGLFPATVMNAAQGMKLSSDETYDYIQDEFLQRSSSVPSSCRRHFDRLIDEAENMVLDLLEKGEN